MIDTGREMNPRETLRQIGTMTVMAICGGRVQRTGPSAIDMVCGNGYRVEIVIEADDTYTVRRVFKRGAKRFVKGEVSNVYCTEISDVAYRAGMFRDAWVEGGVAV